jgi:WD40 repeat protein
LSYLSGLTFNSDSTQLAGRDGDANVPVWDIRSQQLKSMLASDAKSGIAFNPAPGNIRFALSRANQVELWTISGQQMALQRTLAISDQQVGGLAFSLDGKTIFAGSVTMVDIKNLGKRARGVVYRWSTETGQSLGVWMAEKPDDPEGRPSSLHMRPDGAALAFAFTLDSMSCLRLNSYVALWDAASGKLLNLLASDRSTLDAVFSPDSSLMAVNELKDSCVATGSTIEIIEIATQTSRARLVLDKPAFSIAFSPDGKRFAAVTWDTVNTAENRESTVLLWETSTFQKQASYAIKSTQVRRMAFSPNGRFVALGDGDGRLYLLKAASGELAASIPAHPDYIQDIVFNSDGSLLATVGAEGSARFWRIVEEGNS